MAKAKEVRIRMYKQGLGDCFLLTFPRTPKPFHMLIDCGALVSKHYGDDEMKQVVSDIKKTTGGRLDVLVATHEHWDHTSGFIQAQEIFDQIDVAKVWVAWTEDPESEAGRRIREEFQKRKKAVQMAVARIPDEKRNRQLGLYKKAITELLGFYGGLGAASGKSQAEKAWEYILSKGAKKYCDPNRQPLELDGVSGVRVYVLGPPENPDFIRKKVSSKETYDKNAMSLAASFLAAVDDTALDAETRARAFPFEEHHRIPRDTAQHSAFFQQHYGFAEKDKDEWRRIDDDWLTVAGELALNIDSYTNNTCLALAIELINSGKVLLFPGDAQVGNWLSWEERSWKVKDQNGATRTVKSDDLLARTVFYKVGHHGSHNATLREKGLEKMESPNLVAMIPVHRLTAKDQDWLFPYPALWKRLKEKARGRVLLADSPGIDEIAQEAQAALTQQEWKTFQKAVKFTHNYVEYRIPF
jgi:beta-lactamase superfamily II metal-dependent hydrolase